MGIPLLRGRTFSDKEEAVMSHVVVISDLLARRYFPDEDPIGKKIVIEMKDPNVPSEIIGVVGDVKRAGLDSTSEAMSYWPHAELPFSSMMLGIRTESNPMGLAGSVTGIVHQMDPALPVYDVETLGQWLGDSVSRQRFSTLLLGAFAGIAFLLAAVGVYGVVAYSVSQRTREFGVRMALGAETGDVAWIVLGHGLRIAALGIVFGLAGGLAVSQFLRELLFQVSPYDPATFAIVAAVFAGVTLLACWVPARRATKVDPMIALRYE
jgi:predicted permease